MEFHKFTTLPFSYLVQRLCDSTGVSTILKVDHRVEAALMLDIGLIKDGSHLIGLHRAHLFGCGQL